jgi:transcriptional regulator with XRE-family HTH domain
MLFSEMLRRKREAAGLSRAELAKLSGIKFEMIELFESGLSERVSFDNCYQISRVLSEHTRQPFILLDLWSAARGHTAPARVQPQPTAVFTSEVLAIRD